MLNLLGCLFFAYLAFVRSRRHLAIEVLALGHQLEWSSGRFNGHTSVMNERHLRWRLRKYVSTYCHPCRTHLARGEDAPEVRAAEPAERGEVVELSVVGVHYRYSRCAA